MKTIKAIEMDKFVLNDHLPEYCKMLIPVWKQLTIHDKLFKDVYMYLISTSLY